MIGPGTGVAPMMGFLQERGALMAAGTKLGPAHLFFGCRTAASDYIYREQLEGYLASGVLTGLHVAFSRCVCQYGVWCLARTAAHFTCVWRVKKAGWAMRWA